MGQPTTSSERIAELPVLGYWLKQMRVDVSLDRVVGAPQGKWEGVRYGEVALVFITPRVMRGRHFLRPVEEWAAQQLTSLRQALGTPGRAQDCTADRLAGVVRKLGAEQTQAGDPLEAALGGHLLRASALPTETARIDLTSVAVHHQPADEDGLVRFGDSKDHRLDLRPFKARVGTGDPVGLPLATATLAGEQADAPQYFPAWERLGATIGRPDFLLVGECKWASRENRARSHQGGILSPAAAADRAAARRGAGGGAGPARAPASHSPAGTGGARAVRRPGLCRGGPLGVARPGHPHRRDVDRAPRGGAKRGPCPPAARRLARPARPRPGRPERPECQTGQRRGGLGTPRAGDSAAVSGQGLPEPECPRTGHRPHGLGGGRGRPGPQRPPGTTAPRTWTVTVHRRPAALALGERVAGGRGQVTNTPAPRLGVAGAVNCYRQPGQPEQGFPRLNGGLLALTPLFLRDADRLRGLRVLLGSALRVLTLPEFVARRDLTIPGENLTGLSAGNPKRAPAQPPAERLLKAFAPITRYRHDTEPAVWYDVTPLSPLPRRILPGVGIPESVYTPPSAPLIHSG